MAVTEIAPDLYRISTDVPETDLQFNQFLVRDDEPSSRTPSCNVSPNPSPC